VFGDGSNQAVSVAYGSDNLGTSLAEKPNQAFT
jgi:hypothetical protein